MAFLVTEQELATWAQTTLEVVQADPFAQEVLTKTSDLIRDIASQPTWEVDTIPFRARLLALKVARRTYVNPDQEVSTTTGPISSRVLDEAAMAMELSDVEREYLESLAPDGSGEDGLFTISPGRGPVEMRTVYIPDDDQPNLIGPPWEIPYGDTRETDAFTLPGDTYIP